MLYYLYWRRQLLKYYGYFCLSLFCNGFSTVKLYLQRINYSVLVTNTPYFIYCESNRCACSLCTICHVFYISFCQWTLWKLQWKFHYQGRSGSPSTTSTADSYRSLLLWILIYCSSAFSRSRLILTLSSTSRPHTCWRERGSVTSTAACSSTLLSR